MHITHMTHLGISCLFFWHSCKIGLYNTFGMLLIYYKIIIPDQHSEKAALSFYIPILISSLLYQINDLSSFLGSLAADWPVLSFITY